MTPPGAGCRCRVAVVVLAVVAAAACETRPEQATFGVALMGAAHPGAILAAEEINAAGGVRGLPLSLSGLDSRLDTDPDFPRIFAIVQDFVDDETLLGVVGPGSSLATLSSSALFNEAGVPQIVTTATNPAITSIGPWTYRLCPSDAVQGPALADYAYDDWGKRRLAVFFVNDDYGRELAAGLQRRFRARGGEVVASLPHRNLLSEEDRLVVRSTLERLTAEGFGGEADVYVLIQIANTGAAGWTLRTMVDLGIRTDILSGDTLAFGAFIQGLPAMPGRLRVSTFFIPGIASPRGKRFVAAYQARFGREPDYNVALAYEAVYLLRDAVEAEGFTRAGVKRYLDRLIEEGRIVEGLADSFVIGPDRDARRGIFVAEARGGKLHPLKRIAPVEPDLTRHTDAALPRR